MSDTLESPAIETANDSPADRFADVQFESEAARDEAAETPAPAPSTAREDARDEKPEAKPHADPETTWALKRIDALTGKRKAAEERAQAAERERDELRRALAHARGEGKEEPEQTPDQIRQQERARYDEQMRVQQDAQAFGAATAKVAQDLTALHGREAIQTATTNLVARAGLDFESPAHRQVIADIADLPNAGAVYYALSQDPAKAAELLDAPERKQFALLQKFADSVSAVSSKPDQANAPSQAQAPATQISKAPPPVAATSGGGRAVSGRSIYDADLSMDDYVRLRSK